MPRDKRTQEMLDDISVSDHTPYGDRCEKEDNTGRVTCVGKELIGRGDSRHEEEGVVTFDRVQGKIQLVHEDGSQRVRDKLIRRVQKKLR